MRLVIIQNQMDKKRVDLGLFLAGAKYCWPPWSADKTFFLSNLLKPSDVTLIYKKLGDDVTGLLS